MATAVSFTCSSGGLLAFSCPYAGKGAGFERRRVAGEWHEVRSRTGRWSWWVHVSRPGRASCRGSGRLEGEAAALIRFHVQHARNHPGHGRAHRILAQTRSGLAFGRAAGLSRSVRQCFTCNGWRMGSRSGAAGRHEPGTQTLMPARQIMRSEVPCTGTLSNHGAHRHRAPFTTPLPLRDATIDLAASRGRHCGAVGGHRTTLDSTPPMARNTRQGAKVAAANTATAGQPHCAHPLSGRRRRRAPGLQQRLSQVRPPPPGTPSRWPKLALSPILPEFMPLVGRTSPTGVPFQPRY